MRVVTAVGEISKAVIANPETFNACNEVRAEISKVATVGRPVKLRVVTPVEVTVRVTRVATVVIPGIKASSQVRVVSPVPVRASSSRAVPLTFRVPSEAQPAADILVKLVQFVAVRDARLLHPSRMTVSSSVQPDMSSSVSPVSPDRSRVLSPGGQMLELDGELGEDSDEVELELDTEDSEEVELELDAELELHPRHSQL